LAGANSLKTKNVDFIMLVSQIGWDLIYDDYKFQNNLMCK